MDFLQQQSIGDIHHEIHEMLAESRIEDAEEYAIHDYKGFGSIRLSEYEDLETIVKYAEFITEHGELGQELIADYGLDEAQTMLNEHYHGEHDSEVDFAWYVFEEYYNNPIPDNWIFYFDCEAFARDLFINDFCSVEADGKIHAFSQY
ncbi:MAG: antirestriction protein ArdA [Legionellaceae bacterium]|nr:antirestriction protein ArdA [Legionellaceae bacterium]